MTPYDAYNKDFLSIFPSPDHRWLTPPGAAAGHGLLPHRADDGFRRNALPRAAEDEEPQPGWWIGGAIGEVVMTVLKMRVK